MKTEKKTLLARLCAAVMALLGFASCEEIGVMRCEYGCPSVDFKVKGTVTDTDEKPLEGIRVIVRQADDNRPYPRQSYYDEQGSLYSWGGDDTLYTDARGKYESQTFNVFAVYEQKVYFDDVDGEAGGAFEPDSVLLKTAPNKQFKKSDGHWYDGGYEYTVDVKLTKAK